jgi:hypothetical protein
VAGLAAPHEQIAARAALTLRAGGAGEATAALDQAAQAATALALVRNDAPTTATLMTGGASAPEQPDEPGEERWSSHVRIKSPLPDELKADLAAELSFSLPPVETVEPVVHAKPTSAMLHAAAAHEFGGLDLRPFLPEASAAYDEVTTRAKERVRPSTPEPRASAASPSASAQGKQAERSPPASSDEPDSTLSERAGSGRGLRIVLVVGSLLFALAALVAVLSR